MSKLSVCELKSSPCHAFNREEVDFLIDFMDTWNQGGRLSKEREMRPLLGNYEEMLFLTGLLLGTEALGIDWRNIKWHLYKSVSNCVWG